MKFEIPGLTVEVRTPAGGQRWQIWDRARGKCEACGVSSFGFDDLIPLYADHQIYTIANKWNRYFHKYHIDGDRSNNCDDNLMFLCRKCHLRKPKDFWRKRYAILKGLT